MDFYREHLLSVITYTPLVGALVLLLPVFSGREKDNAVRWAANGIALLGFLLSLPLWFWFDRSADGFQFVEKVPWIPSIGVQYFFGVDGISTLLILLTTLLGAIAVLSSWTAITDRVRQYYVFLLLLQAGMLGTFCALDMFLFYVFWEVMLVPMYFLIGIWGGARRLYAAIKFFLFTLVGSVVMLLGILALYFHAKKMPGYEAAGSFDYTVWMQMGIPADLQFWVFLAFFLGFAIKVPMFPFHTWLPDAHVEAPTAISVILAGVLLKMGTYGLMRISFPVFPDVTVYFALPMAILGVINIIYGALCAMAQSDLKKLVAYSSVSHMGFCLLGMAALTPLGMVGASMQMFSHGMITAMLFFLVGVVYDRAHHRQIDGFGGLGAVVPVYTAFIGFAFFASLGLPGLSGFIAEQMVFLGSFGVFRTLVIIAALGIIFVAAFHLWALQRVFLGPLNPKYATLEEINAREIFCLAPLVVLIMAVGVWPMPVLNLMNASLVRLVDLVKVVI